MVAIYLVEGETEKYLIEDLKKNEITISAQVVRFNLWDNDIGKLIANIPPANKGFVCIIYDTDVLYHSETNNRDALINKFKNNIKRLIDKKYNIILLQQTFNLEDELGFCCNCDITLLYKHFNVTERNKLKTAFLNTRDIVKYLEKINFQKEKLWIKPIDGYLEQYEQHKGNYHSLVSNKNKRKQKNKKKS